MAADFTYTLKTETVSFKYARGVSDRSGREFHPFHEILLFLDGNAEFISESCHIRPQPGMVLLIPKEAYHQLILHGEPTDYQRCVLQFSDTPELLPLIGRKLTAVSALQADGELRYLFGKLIRRAEAAEGDAALLIKSVLALLLDALPAARETDSSDHPQNERIRCAIEYINRHPDGKLPIGDIAAACHVSVSSLSHLFREEMNISIHQFILKKRLICAHQRIAAGEAASAAAAECGFQDYSGFYKQYKKLFGFSPSHKCAAGGERG